MNHFDFERLLLTKAQRRGFLMGAGMLTGMAIASQWPTRRVVAQPNFSGYPFTLGVASGDPLPDSVVLWTRLAPEPLNGGGMPSVNVPVQWQIATDENMRNVVLRGTAVATPELGHSVRVVVGGLQPARWYWYQFKAGNEVSPIGRTRTAPPLGAPIDQFRFAFVSCQHYEQGYYTAYKYIAAEDLDLVVHLGDYIYEGNPVANRPRRHVGPEPYTLEEYRNRHALYKTDPNLQAAHAAFPWILTWDDHEVDNNYANDISENNDPRDAFLIRRAAAYQAYYEHMPLRSFSKPNGPNMQLYRRLSFGSLAEFHVLDTRQYRTDQPCGDGSKPRCAEAYDPNATLTGSQQEQWLFQGLDKSQARWNVIAQQVMMAEVDSAPGPDERYPMDQWAGYVVARDRFLNFLGNRRPSNPVVISGDIHSNWVGNLKTNFRNPNSPTVGTEFVGTSISSGGDGSDTTAQTAGILAENPHIKFFNGQRGYVSCKLTRDRWQSDYRVVPFVTQPDAPITTRASFVVENGQPGAQRV